MMKSSFKSIALMIIALVIAAVGLTACEGDIVESKEAAKGALTQAFSTYKEDDYTTENWQLLVAAKDDGLDNIDAATTDAEVNKAKNDAIVAMAAVLSIDGEAEFIIAKAAAVTELQEQFATFEQADYSSTNWVALVAAKDDGITHLNAATTPTELSSAKVATMTAMDAIATLKQLYEVGSQTEFNEALKFSTEQIKLNSDIALVETIELTSNLKVDLNGFTMTKSGGTAITVGGTAKVTIGGGTINVIDGSVIKVDGAKAELRVLDGKYISQYESAANKTLLIALNLQNGAKATIEGGEFTASGTYSDNLFVEAQAMKSASNSKLTINNATIISNQYGISVMDGGELQFNDGSITASWQAIASNNTKPTANIDINGGAITSTEDVAIYMPAQGRLSIDGATVTGLTALDIRMGTITIGATAILNATGEEVVLTKEIGSTQPEGSTVLINRNLYTKQTAATNDLNLTIAVGATMTATSGNLITSYNWKTVEQSVTLVLGTYTLSSDYNLNADTNELYKLDVSSELELDKALNNMVDGDIIKLKNNITLTTRKNITKPITTKIDLKGKKIDCIIDNDLSRLFAVDNADAVLEIYNGVIDAVGSGTTNANGAGAYGAFLVKNGELLARDLIVKNHRPWGLNIYVAVGGEAILTNVQIISKYGGGLEAAGGSIILNNCNISQEGYYDYCSTAIAASTGGTVTVNGGEYHGQKYSVYIFNSGANITINSGNFSAEVVLKADAEKPTTESHIVINGGTFEGKEEKQNNATITYPSVVA